MADHPLFDETVVDRLRGVTDVLVGFMPESIGAVDVVLRPGSPDDPGAATLTVSFPDSSPPTGWAIPEPLNQAGRDFAAAWLAHGHPLPAFRFTHRRGDDGRWRATAEPLAEW